MLQGVAEKGPFASGSSVSVFALTNSGQRGALLAATNTIDDLGTYSVEIDADQTVELQVIGPFMNEVDGSVSSTTLRLGSIVHVGSADSAAANVNLLTHLAMLRHRTLLADQSVTDAAAAAQARADLLAVLEVILPPPAIASLYEAGLFADASHQQDSGYLVALSALFSERAHALAAENGTDHVTELQTLMDSVAGDIEDGELNNMALTVRLRATLPRVDPVSVTENLENLAATAGEPKVPGDVTLFLDNDLDGVVNIADTDDDNDGIDDAHDAFPMDWSCYLDSQGNGESCTVDATLPSSYQASIVVEDDKGVLYLLDGDNSRIVRWSMDEQAYGWSLDIPAGAVSMTYSPTHDRLYVGHSSGEITAIEAGGAHTLSSFATLTGAVPELTAAGDFLLAVDDAGNATTYSTAGTAIDQATIRPHPGTLTWNRTFARAVWLHRHTGEPQAIEINPASGAFGDTSYHPSGLGRGNAPLRYSANGGHAVNGNGTVFRGMEHTWAGSLGGNFVDVAWIGSRALAGLRDNAFGARIEHLDLRGDVIEYGEFSGTPLRAFHRGNVVHVITQLDRPEFHMFDLGGDFDGDGVANSDDAFPTDPAASADSDSDGYPDAWNEGQAATDSTTGLRVDRYPADSICYLPGHGDGTVCDIAGNVPTFDPDEVVADSSGVIYLLNRSQKRIYRWNSTTGYLNPLTTRGGEQPGLLRYSPESHRLYLTYSSGRISYWDLTNPMAERLFAALPRAPGGLQPAGNYVWAGGASRFNATFELDGTVADGSDYLVRTSRISAWNPALERIYLFRDGISPNDLQFLSIDQTNGSLGMTMDSPYHGDYSIMPPIRLSLDGSLALLGSGDVYNASDLTRIGGIPGGFIDALWTSDAGTLVIRDVSGITQLQRRVADGRVVETRSFSGTPRAVLRTGSNFTVVTDLNGPVFHTYAPSNDSDGDGVQNLVDAFPLDPAASADLDGDGYPDAWLGGMTEVDSTTGLILDAYVSDAACYLPEHGDGVTCDITSTMPDYVPASMAVDADGVLYLFSPDNNRIYRRETATGEHLNPLIIGQDIWLYQATPMDMIYHRAHDRLYLSYDNGEINYIDLASGSEEVRLATAPGRIGGMADVGNFLLVQDDTGAWNTHHVFDASGGLRASVDWNHRSPVYAWNETLDRVYFLRSSGYLHYEEIDQTTGGIVADGETRYDANYLTLPLLRVSKDGTQVLMGKGTVFDASSLDRMNGIPGGFVDAQWTADGGVVTLAENGGTAQILRRDSRGEIVDGTNFQGIPLALFPASDGYVVVLDEGIPEIVSYVPSDDADNDGVPNREDDFPTDPAASVDTDRDGYADAWNPGMRKADSTTGLRLDDYPNDSACYFPGHGDGFACDVESTVRSYTPTSMAVDESGTLYLFSPENGKIYRQDTDTGDHLNPFIVNRNTWVDSAPPSIMVYHPAHNRLYLSYDSGEISYIDLASEPDEQQLTIAPDRVYGMAEVGNFLLVQDYTGAWATHHIFDALGGLRTSVDWNYHSRVYAWNPALSRVYFFRDGTSPNDLHYEEIDQATGQIVDDGETPYHGDYPMQPPIRLSQDGSKVLLGGGDLFDAASLNWLGAIPGGFVDAQWTSDGGIVAVTDEGGSTRVVRRAPNGVVVDGAVFAGKPLAMFAASDGYDIVVDNGVPELIRFTPSDDTDNDGVPNSDDAFPVDPAASVDTDNDGYPDTWNPGMTETDSTTGLTLDAYADDTACYLPAHGDGTTCDVTATMPDYRPKSVAVDNAGIAYLFSPWEKRIFRWDSVAREHLNPLIVGVDDWTGTETPTIMIYHAAHNRLYLGYESGKISYIDLGGGIEEEHFAALSLPVNGLADVGNFLLAQDDTGAWESHHIYDADGVLKSSREWNHYSRSYSFNASLGRVYHFRDGSSPNDLLYEDIDQATGEITAHGDSPYHGDYAIRPPIRSSTDSARVVLGSGDVYDAADLTWIGSYPSNFKDAVWLDDGRLVTIRGDGNDTIVDVLNTAFGVDSSRVVGNLPLAVLGHRSNVIVVTSGAKPEFTVLTP